MLVVEPRRIHCKRRQFSMLECLFAIFTIVCLTYCLVYSCLEFKNITLKKKYLEISSHFIDSELEAIRSISQKDFARNFSPYLDTSIPINGPRYLPEVKAYKIIKCVDVHGSPSTLETGIRSVKIDLSWRISRFQRGNLSYATIITAN